MVICNGSELFTGNCLMVISLLDHKITFKALMKNYLFVYLGNLIGSLFVSVLFVYGHIPGLYDGLLAQNMVNTAVTKVSLSFSEVFFRGILCNVMVCVAVWMGMSATHVSGKILAVYPPISAFVLCGFEHCVANMFYIPAGMMTASAYGIAAEGLNIGTFILNNLIPATIGMFVPSSQQEGTAWNTFLTVFNSTSALYAVIYFLLIIMFSYFYATIQFNPVEVANNLKKNGGFIPGFRPGRPTAEFLTKVLSRLTFFGAIYLGIVAILPIITENITGIVNMSIGGTSVIIVVGVALETVKALEAQMLMRHYKGFLE